MGLGFSGFVALRLRGSSEAQEPSIAGFCRALPVLLQEEPHARSRGDDLKYLLLEGCKKARVTPHENQHRSRRHPRPPGASPHPPAQAAAAAIRTMTDAPTPGTPKL